MAVIFLLIAFFAFIFILIQLYKYEESKYERDIISAGKRGEKIAFDVLNCLPEEYCIYENICVTYNGKTSELDNIIVGPTGIFIVEVKNHKGIISGDYDEDDEKNLLLYIENRPSKMERKQIDKAKNLVIKLQESNAVV